MEIECIVFCFKDQTDWSITFLEEVLLYMGLKLRTFHFLVCHSNNFLIVLSWMLWIGVDDRSAVHQESACRCFWSWLRRTSLACVTWPVHLTALAEFHTDLWILSIFPYLCVSCWPGELLWTDVYQLHQWEAAAIIQPYHVHSRAG